jgi:hypothetical protein
LGNRGEAAAAVTAASQRAAGALTRVQCLEEDWGRLSGKGSSSSEVGGSDSMAAAVLIVYSCWVSC